MTPESAPFELHDTSPPTEDFREAVLSGLALPRKAVPAKFFYDARGSELFDAICETPEYYPTRTEAAILAANAPAMAAFLGDDALVIEYGSGSGQKTRLLLDALRPAAYVPVDISSAALSQSAAAIAADYPELRVVAVCADYTRPLNLPLDGIPHRSKAVFFPGSTVGNFTPEEALVFLRGVYGLLSPGGRVLIGVDLKKPAEVLDAAYNDAHGVTAAFNLNLLERVNRELEGDFDAAAFEHRAFYNADLGRVEMHLMSRRRQAVRVAGQRFAFATGETIHTENSYKYAVIEFQYLARRAGFQPEQVWLDERRLFSVHGLACPA